MVNAGRPTFVCFNYRPTSAFNDSYVKHKRWRLSTEAMLQHLLCKFQCLGTLALWLVHVW